MSSSTRGARNPERAGSDRRARKRKKRRRSPARSNSLGWLLGLGSALVVVVVGWNLWQSGTLAKPLEASRAEESTDLLPLAASERPLAGGHDMARIPSQTPVPGKRPEGVDLPRLELPSFSHDFGRVARRPDVAHIFALQNTGTADLVVSNLVTSCGCTKADLSSSIIPPGQRADLTVTFDPDYHVTTGEVLRLVWFATNDPEQPWVEVRIMAVVTT
jgi:hypothetical protein